MSGPVLAWVAAAAIAGVVAAAPAAPVPEAPPSRPPAAASVAAEPALPAGLAMGWYAVLETSVGTIVARLLPEQAPQAVAHFAAIAEGRLSWVDPLTGQTKQGRYYDGLKVHFSTAAQRFEVGDPTGTGRGAPPIYVPPEVSGPINFDGSGRLGMTRSALGKISAVQFFVTSSRAPWFNDRHPCFGEVVAGREVVAAITGAKTFPNGKPVEPVELRRVRIRKVGEPAALPEPVPFTPKAPEFGIRKE